MRLILTIKEEIKKRPFFGLKKSDNISNICKRVCEVLVNDYGKIPFSDVSIVREDINELLKIIFDYDNKVISLIRSYRDDLFIYKSIIDYLSDGIENNITLVSSHILKDVFISESISYMRLVKLKEILITNS